MSNTLPVRSVAAILSTLVILASSNAAIAAGSCKGLAQAACGEQASCTWIKSYKTSKGKTVDAYCRNKPSSSKGKSVPDKSAAPASGKQG